MGENLISLAKKGGTCFGLDISEHMLCYARERDRKISLVREDMREFTSFPGVSFDLILSIYSLEYLESLKEFRDVLATLFNRMRPGATFVFCFSHPLQHYRHSMLRNESATSGTENPSPFIYSFRDVILCLNETGFTIDRIVEQQTSNPSAMSYDEGRIFPYHFHKGKNPCSTLLDKESNAAPHTVIYKVKKPDRGSLMKRQMSLAMQFGGVRIWGEYRRVQDSFSVLNRRHQILKLESRDAVVGICSVMRFTVTESEIQKGASVRIGVANQKQAIPRNSLLGILFLRSSHLPFDFTFQQDWIPVPEHHKLLNTIYISRIDPIFGEFINAFPREEIGVLVFVNGVEPGNGKVGLQDFFPSLGDRVEMVYVACDRTKAASGDFIKNDKQLDLFNFSQFETSSFSDES
jgi:SAM-dependent methyltransferase